MVGIPLGIGKGLQLLGVNPDTEVPRILGGVVLLPALGQQSAVVVVAVSLMAAPVDAATCHGELERDTPCFVSLLDPAQQLESLALLRPLPSGYGCLARNARWLIIFGAMLWLSWPIAVVSCRAVRVL